MHKVMLVTGASRGIGAATARLAGQRGYTVVVNYLGRRDAADAVVAHIEQAGSHALAVQGDVADESAVKALFAIIDKAFGPLRRPRQQRWNCAAVGPAGRNIKGPP